MILLIEQLVLLVNDTIEVLVNHKNGAKLIEILRDFKSNRLDGIWEQANHTQHNPYVVSLVGMTNVGKSTLMEAFLGVPVVPSKNGPATAIPVRYKYSAQWKLEITYNDFKTEERTFANNEINQLSELLKKKVIGTENQTLNTNQVDVYGPMQPLQDGLVLMDTPGFGAAHTSDHAISHEEALEQALNDVHRVYFCVAAAGDEWVVHDKEAEFYKKIKNKVSHIVVTKWEGEDEMRNDYRDGYASLFEGKPFIFLNARRAKAGIEKSNIDMVKKANLDELVQIIKSHSTIEKRLLTINEETIQAWKDLNVYIKRKGICDIPWRTSTHKQFLARLEETNKDTEIK